MRMLTSPDRVQAKSTVRNYPKRIHISRPRTCFVGTHNERRSLVLSHSHATTSPSEQDVRCLLKWVQGCWSGVLCWDAKEHGEEQWTDPGAVYVVGIWRIGEMNRQQKLVYGGLIVGNTPTEKSESSVEFSQHRFSKLIVLVYYKVQYVMQTATEKNAPTTELESISWLHLKR